MRRGAADLQLHGHELKLNDLHRQPELQVAADEANKLLLAARDGLLDGQALDEAGQRKEERIVDERDDLQRGRDAAVCSERCPVAGRMHMHMSMRCTSARRRGGRR